MRLLVGIVVCVLAGCVAQREQEDRGDAGRAVLPALAAAPDPGTTLRIGVEYLPPETADDRAPEVERTIAARPERARPAPTTLVERTMVPEARHTWALGALELAAIDDPVARATLHFVDDLVREDKRRTEREVRLPFLDWQPADLDLGQRLWSEQKIGEAQSEWLDENGASLLKRPLRRALRRLPLVSEVELRIDDFRSSYVPMSEPYRKRHRSERKLGRVSVRLHASHLDDPIEVVYVRSGVRVGSSLENGKLSIDIPLAENLALTLRTRRHWSSAESRVRADLSYRHSATTSLRLAAGDDMDFLSTSSIYSLFEAPMDGAPGLVLYAVHVF